MERFAEQGGGPNILTSANELESLYERFPWLYAVCRDHLFRDDTEKIIAALWSTGVPSRGESLLELGCGPGFYARQLAARFKHLQVTGIDRSARQLRRAHVAASRLDNCSFEQGNVLALDRPDASVDGVVVSRLFFILSERKRALAEIHRVLRSGGRCFIAKPRSALRATEPLRVMLLLADLSNFVGGRPSLRRRSCRATVMTAGELDALIESQKWRVVRRWQDGWYHYTVCEKDST